MKYYEYCFWEDPYEKGELSYLFFWVFCQPTTFALIGFHLVAFCLVVMLTHLQDNRGKWPLLENFTLNLQNKLNNN